jgi:hypothetical protein
MAIWMLSRSRSRRAAASIVLVAVATAVSAPAAAQDAQAQSMGRALFDEGVALFNKADFASACPKLEASLNQYPGIGTRGKLAECYEKLGRNASAWLAYREVAQLAARSGDATRERVAADRARSLEPKLAYVTVVVPPGRDINGLVVKRDGREIEHAKLGSAQPIDPGPTALDVSAPGRRSVTAQLTATQGQTLRYDVPILLPVAPPSSSASPALAAPIASEPPPPAPEDYVVQRDPPSWQKPVGLVLVGAGVVGLGIGGFFGLSARSTYDGAFEGGGCDRATKVCDAPGQSAVEDARSKAMVSTVLFGAGGALVVVGAIVFLTAPSAKPQAIHIAPTTYAGGGGITVGGAL